VPFYGHYLPWQAVLEGILFEGSPGAGKSIPLRQILRCILSRVGQGDRVFIWDYKGIERQYLGTLQLKCPVWYLNPLDEDGYGIDLCRQITSRLDADAFAEDILSPFQGKVEGEDGSTFLLATRAVLAEVIKVNQQEAPENWSFADVLNGCRSEKKLWYTLQLTSDGQDILDDVFGANRQAKGVMMTLRANLNTLMPLAAAMQHTINITLKDWVSGREGVLVLMNNKDYKTTLYPFFRWVFKRCVSHVISRPDNGERYTFFLDEVRHAPFLSDVSNSPREHHFFSVVGTTS
jgi:hypothetical protein